MAWQPAERLQKNDQSQYRALINGQWTPVEKAQRNDQNQFRVWVSDDARESTSGTAQDYLAAVARGTSPYMVAAIGGAAAGSIIPGIGTVIGAGAGVGALGVTDLVTYGLNTLAPLFGATPSKSLSENLNNLIYPGLPETRGVGPQLLQSTLAGATSGYGMAKGAQALSEGMALADRGRTLPRVVNQLAVSPSSQAVAGAGAGAGSYLASQFGQAVGIQDPALLELLGVGGSVAGGVVAGVTPFALKGTAKYTGRVVQNLAEPFLPGGKDSIRARAFIDTFKNEPEQMQIAINLLRSGRTPEQAANDMGHSGFAALIQSSRRADPLYQSKLNAKNESFESLQANRTAIAQRQLELTQQGLDQRIAAAQAREEVLAAKRGTDVESKQATLGRQIKSVDPVEAGATLTSVRGDLLKALKPKIKALYESAFKLAPKPFSFAEVETAATDIANNPATALNPSHAPYTSKIMSLYQSKTPADTNVLVSPTGERLSPAPEQQPAMVSLRDADTFLHAVNKDLDSLDGVQDATANATRANLMQLKTAAQNAINAGVSGDAKTAYQTASDTWRTQLSEPFRQGWVANLERKGATGTPILAPEEVTSAAIKSTDTASRFVRAFGTSDTAKSALRNGIEELYRKTVVNKDTGAIDPKKHADFMDTYGRQLKVLDDAGVNIGRTLEQYGTGARRLRIEAEVAAEASKGVPNRVKEQFANEQTQIARVTKLAKIAAAKLKDVPPKRSIENIKVLTKDLPQIRQMVEDVLAQLRQQKRFNKLANLGESAGGDVLGLASASAGNLPLSLSKLGSVINLIMRRAHGQLNPELAAKIAAETFNAAGFANMIEAAPAAAARTGKISSIGRMLNAPTTRPNFSLPLTTVNALSPPSVNNNAMAQ